jgi:hypothetical protein
MEEAMTDPRGEAERKEAIVNALLAYKQADMDGVMVLVSRQACDEAADLLRSATPANARAVAEKLVEFRDVVLNQRGALAENGMNGDQVNDVLGEFDAMLGDAMPEAPLPPNERELSAAVERERDAARYRWLRAHSTQPAEGWSTHSNPESLDATVDEAMRLDRSPSE